MEKKKISTNYSEKELLEWKYRQAIKFKQYDRAKKFLNELEKKKNERWRNKKNTKRFT